MDWPVPVSEQARTESVHGSWRTAPATTTMLGPRKTPPGVPCRGSGRPDPDAECGLRFAVPKKPRMAPGASRRWSWLRVFR